MGIYHVRHRAYDPYHGRWLQPDPIGIAGGFNLYQYCDGEPLDCIDPMGLYFESIATGLQNSQWAHVRGLGTALGVAGGALEGMRDGAVLMGNQLAFEAHDGLAAEAERLKMESADDPTVVIISEASGVVLRETLIAIATMGVGNVVGKTVQVVASTNVGRAVTLSTAIRFNAATLGQVNAGMVANTVRAAWMVTEGSSQGGRDACATGVAAEEQVSRHLGIPRNTGPGRETIPGTGPGGIRVPDFPTELSIREVGGVVEVKDHAGVLSGTPQIRDLIDYAASRDVPLIIYTNARLPSSGVLHDAIGRGRVQIRPLP